MAAYDTPEYIAVKRHLVALKDAVIRGEIPAVLFQEDVISEDAFCKATNTGLGRDERGNSIIKEVLQSLRLNSGVFDKLCDALSNDKCTKGIADEMRGNASYSSYVHDRYSRSPPCPKLLGVVPTWLEQAQIDIPYWSDVV